MKLEIKDLTKLYGNKTALNHFTYTFQTGVYGLLGPNGAGKTTLMNLLTDNLPSDEGEIVWDGEDIHKLGDKYRSIIGYMPQQQALYAGFTINRFLFYISALKGIDRKEAKAQITNILKKVNLEEQRENQMSRLSGGMKQRVLIAQALLGEPKLIIMDEPTAGLDPEERIRIRNVIAEIAKDRIIIVATHIVSDIECIASEVLFLKKGNLLCGGHPNQLYENWSDKIEQVTKREDTAVRISPLEELYLTVNRYENTEQ